MRQSHGFKIALRLRDACRYTYIYACCTEVDEKISDGNAIGLKPVRSLSLFQRHLFFAESST